MARMPFGVLRAAVCYAWYEGRCFHCLLKYISRYVGCHEDSSVVGCSLEKNGVVRQAWKALSRPPAEQDLARLPASSPRRAAMSGVRPARCAGR